jgi:hypothetical protein
MSQINTHFGAENQTKLKKQGYPRENIQIFFSSYPRVKSKTTKKGYLFEVMRDTHLRERKKESNLERG